jgi:hypothetical protein
MRMALAEGATPGSTCGSMMRNSKRRSPADQAVERVEILPALLRRRWRLTACTSVPTTATCFSALESARRIGNADRGDGNPLAAQEARRFLYDDFCSWYIEAAKDRLYNGDKGAIYTLSKCFDNLLQMMHPFMPFVTEDIRSAYSDEPLITSEW